MALLVPQARGETKAHLDPAEMTVLPAAWAHQESLAVEDLLDPEGTVATLVLLVTLGSQGRMGMTGEM